MPIVTQVPALHLSDAVNRISISPTMAVLVEAGKLKARGIDVADFGPGEPDFPTPEHIKQAAIRALEENHTKYTPTGGIMPLREAVCEWHAKNLGSSYEPKECIVTSGGKLALFNAVCSLINPGDEVLIPAPYWVSYPDIVQFSAGVPKFISTLASDKFCLRATDVEKAITPKTKMLIVNSPNNPTGAVIPQGEFARILEVCQRRGIWLMSDECYSHFVYGSAKPYSIASVPAAKDFVIIAGSLSKTFAMTGWRMGYALAPEALVNAMIKIQSQTVSNSTSIAQYAALEALRGPMDMVAVMLAEYERRRARIVSGLRAIPGVECTEPQGAFYAFPKIPARGGKGAGDATLIARELLDQERVALVSGDAFGAPSHLRLSYATSIDRIEEGLRRLTRFFSAPAA
jgi:aspartate aminotransferase